MRFIEQNSRSIELGLAKTPERLQSWIVSLLPQLEQYSQLYPAYWLRKIKASDRQLSSSGDDLSKLQREFFLEQILYQTREITLRGLRDPEELQEKIGHNHCSIGRLNQKTLEYLLNGIVVTFLDCGVVFETQDMRNVRKEVVALVKDQQIERPASFELQLGNGLAAHFRIDKDRQEKLYKVSIFFSQVNTNHHHVSRSAILDAARR